MDVTTAELGIFISALMQQRERALHLCGGSVRCQQEDKNMFMKQKLHERDGG